MTTEPQYVRHVALEDNKHKQVVDLQLGLKQ